jgi:hypothetical protein
LRSLLSHHSNERKKETRALARKEGEREKTLKIDFELSKQAISFLGIGAGNVNSGQAKCLVACCSEKFH